VTHNPPHGLRTLRLSGIVAGTALLFATIMVLGSLTQGYSQFSDTISRLASRGQPLALLARSSFVLYGLLVVAGSGPLGDYVPRRRKLLACLIAAYGVAGVAAGVAPKDPAGGAHTLPSQIHVAATIAGGAIILVAILLAAIDAPRRIDQRIAGVVGGLTVVAAIIFRFSWGSELYGLVERVLVAAPALWLVLLDLRMLSRRRRGHAIGTLCQARPEQWELCQGKSAH